MKIKTLFFDLDGTLIDSEKMAAECLTAVMKSLGMGFDSGDADFITGRTWESAFDLLYGKYSFPIPREDFAKRVLDAYRDDLAKNLQEVTGARVAIPKLAQEYRMALISGSHRREILFALEHLGIRNHFEVVLGAEDYPKSKPAPDGYLKALSMMNARPEETLVFEDSEAGIASGLASGLWVVAITSTNHLGIDQSCAHFQLRDWQGVGVEWVKGLERANK